MRLAWHLMPLLLAVTADNAVAQTTLDSLLPGRWEGSIEGSFRRQEVSWHFSTDRNGRLRGYMGPTVLGMPTVPMDNLELTEDSISFRIDSQHAEYRGTLRDGVITGIWQQGTKLPLQMKKRIFAFAVPAAWHEQLPGKWMMTRGGTDAELVFSETANGFITGNLSIPAAGMSNIPLAEIYITEEGLVTLATDNGHSFIGSMVTGVMFGDYQNGRSQRDGLFVREDFETGHLENLLSESEQKRLLGSWTREGQENIRFDFSQSADGAVHATFTIRGIRREDPVLSIDVRGADITMVTEGGRQFVGSLNGDEMSGQYRSGRRPVSVTMQRSQTVEPPTED